MTRDTRHVPVLLGAVLNILDPRPGHIVVDCTLGLGGHAAAILQRIKPAGRLIGIDFDPANIVIARENLTSVGGEFELHHGNF
ncbi:MAG TPA: 16S rRNA (cytosine(1402)-N(4))-methyltransferase, partial [Telmatospirillum sp.]|nr:16S rRNA (cytosine(1402)-N(4))-methyltransferase [Telmatospirillum sp.]